MDESKLEELLKKSWKKETSSDPDNWSSNNPSYGQCAVTSAVVADYLGGEIVWAEAILPDGNKISHYFNKINGQEKDFTRCQFPNGTIIPEGVPKTKGFASTREYILSFPQTAIRYQLLKLNVENIN